MIGRLVHSDWHQIRGTVVDWDPLTADMCDVKVREENGHEIWCASHDLQPDDGWGPLPSRQGAQTRARAQTISDLEVIRAKLIAEWGEPWPGAEHGKAIIGRAIDGALAEVKGK